MMISKAMPGMMIPKIFDFICLVVLIGYTANVTKGPGRNPKVPIIEVPSVFCG